MLVGLAVRAAVGAGVVPALGNVTMSEVMASLLVSLAVAVCTPVADVILSSAKEESLVWLIVVTPSP
jgi:hypothetical protein